MNSKQYNVTLTGGYVQLDKPGQARAGAKGFLNPVNTPSASPPPKPVQPATLTRQQIDRAWTERCRAETAERARVEARRVALSAAVQQLIAQSSPKTAAQSPAPASRTVALSAAVARLAAAPIRLPE